MNIRRRSILQALLCIGLAVFLPGTGIWAETGAQTGIQTDMQSETEKLHAPEILENADMSTGQETVWSCVNFGTYPAAEIVTDEWDAVDGYAVRDGDVIADSTLFQSLSEADWENNRTTLEGRQYVRINSRDAVTAAENREQHYRWKDPEAWHYFLEEPVRWRVLSIKDGKTLLLADRILDCAPFNLTDRAVAWETCSLRSWLNGYGRDQNADGIDYTGIGFYDLAFNSGEQAAILPVTCITPANLDYRTDSGPDTQDKVFLLSNEDVYADASAAEHGFYAGRGFDDPSKRFSSTMYAKCRGAWWSPVSDYKGNSFWFMRISGYTSYNVTYICDFGYVYSRGTTVTCDDAGILPAICIDLEKADFSYAGETSSTEILHHEENNDEDHKEDPSVPGGLHNPLITDDETLPGGKKVTWSAVTFGTYPQTEILGTGETADGQEVDPILWNKLQEAEWGNDKTSVDGAVFCRMDGRFFRYDPVTWRVLEITDGTALLLADQALDCFPYHPALIDVNWKDSAVRSWLNSLGPDENQSEEDYLSAGEGFFNTAFNNEEKQAVIAGPLPNADNHYFGTSCGEETYDRVFLLSEDEIFSSLAAESYGFQTSDAVADPAKRFIPTTYAQCRGAWQSNLDESRGNGFWILRSNGYTAANTVYVGELGHIFNRGIPVTCKDCSIVPAIRIDLKLAEVTSTGEISSAEKVQGSEKVQGN